MGISIKETGILFDARQSEVVAAVDRDGKTVAYKPIRDVMVIRVKPSTPPAEVLLKPVVAKIWEILETQYGGDPEQMALDLGLPVEEMQAILQGKGWINARWFLNRLATLLYRNRDELVAIYNGERNLGDARVIDADIALLEGAMAVYEKREGKGSESRNDGCGAQRRGGVGGQGRQQGAGVADGGVDEQVPVDRAGVRAAVALLFLLGLAADDDRGHQSYQKQENHA